MGGCGMVEVLRKKASRTACAPTGASARRVIAHKKSPGFPGASRSTALRRLRQLAKHVLQDAAVAEELALLRGQQQHLDGELLDRTIGTRGLDRRRLRLAAVEAGDVEDFVALQAER